MLLVVAILIASHALVSALNCDVTDVRRNTSIVIAGCREVSLTSIETTNVSITILDSTITTWALSQMFYDNRVSNLSVSVRRCTVLRGLVVLVVPPMVIDIVLLHVAFEDCNISVGNDCCALLIDTESSRLISNVTMVLLNSVVSHQSTAIAAAFSISLKPHPMWPVVRALTVTLHNVNASIRSPLSAALLHSELVDVILSDVAITVSDCNISVESNADAAVIRFSTYTGICSNISISALSTSLYSQTPEATFASATGGADLISLGGGEWINLTVVVSACAVKSTARFDEGSMTGFAANIFRSGQINNTSPNNTIFRIARSCVSLDLRSAAGGGVVLPKVFTLDVSVFGYYRVKHGTTLPIVHIIDSNATVHLVAPCSSQNVLLSYGNTPYNTTSLFTGCSVAIIAFTQADSAEWVVPLNTTVTRCNSYMFLYDMGTTCTISPRPTTYLMGFPFPALAEVYLVTGVVALTSRDLSPTFLSSLVGVSFPVEVQNTSGVSYNQIMSLNATIEDSSANLIVRCSKATMLALRSINATLQEASVTANGASVVNSNITISALSLPTVRGAVSIVHMSKLNSTLVTVIATTVTCPVMEAVYSSFVSNVTIAVQRGVIIVDRTVNPSASAFSVESSSRCDHCSLSVADTLLWILPLSAASQGSMVSVDESSMFVNGSHLRMSCVEWRQGSGSQAPLSLPTPLVVGIPTAWSCGDIHAFLSRGSIIAVSLLSLVLSAVGGGAVRSPVSLVASMGMRFSSGDGCQSVTFEDAADGNYFGIDIGPTSDGLQFYRGTVVGAVIVLSAAWVVGAVLTVALKVRRKVPWRRALATLMMPSSMYAALQWALLPGTAASLALLGSGRHGAGDVFLVTMWLLCSGGALGIVVVFPCWRAHAEGMVLPARRHSKKSESRWARAVCLLDSKSITWNNRQEGSLFVERFGGVFTLYRKGRHWYALVEVGIMVGFAIIQGLSALSADDMERCSRIVTSFAAMEISSFVALAALRPYDSLIDNVIGFTLQPLSAAHGVLLTFRGICSSCSLPAKILEEGLLYISLICPVLQFAFALSVAASGLAVNRPPSVTVWLLAELCRYCVKRKQQESSSAVVITASAVKLHRRGATVRNRHNEAITSAVELSNLIQLICRQRERMSLVE